MLYLSHLLGMPVEDQHHERIGKLIDVLVPGVQEGMPQTLTYPAALLVEGEAKQVWRVPLTAIERKDSVICLRVPVEQLTPQIGPITRPEVSLTHDVLDKQVIDVEHRKAVRVNDVCFGDDWHLYGIDNSNFGLVRRLAPHWLLGARSQHVPTTLIPWESIELPGWRSGPLPEVSMTTEASLRPARSPSGQLAELHPADIAEIVQQFTPGEGARIIESLDTETAADTMEEIDTERQRHIIENLQIERAADILESMEPDEAADLLAQLPEEQAQELLRLMEPEESEEVQELLEYEADTAGGLMTTNYVALNQTRTVAEALEAIRTNIREHDVRIAYIYCIEDESQEEYRLLGVISLWELLIAEPTQRLQDVMETDVISVEPDTDAREVAEIMAKYNLLAVPVLSAEGMLEGVVTVDDALDVLLPPEKRHRQAKLY
jgi:magnesium transporter